MSNCCYRLHIECQKATQKKTLVDNTATLYGL